MLQSRGVLDGAVVLDAFCGTGALGLEALSQGADFCVFMDQSGASVALCRRNVATLQEESSSLVLKTNATKPVMRPDDISPASLVFLDPPYHRDFLGMACKELHKAGWIAPDAFFVLEMDKREVFSIPNFVVETEKQYGDTMIVLGYCR